MEEMSNWITILSSVAVLLLSAVWIWMRRGKQKHHLPHHKGWPLVGNLFQVRRNRPELTFTEWANDLGPVFSVKMSFKEFVVLNSFEAIYEALVQKGSLFAHRSNKNTYRLMLTSDNSRSIVRRQPDSRWRKLRKICQRKIKMYDTGIKRIEDISNSLIQNLVGEFKEIKGSSFNPKELVYNTVMNVVMTLLLGKTFSIDEVIFQKVVRLEQKFLPLASPSGRGVELDLFPWLRFFGNQTYKEIMEIIDLRNQIWELVKEEAALGDQSLGADEEDVRIVTALREALAEEGSELTERDMKMVVVSDLTIAATTTTSNSTYAYLNIIGHHPEVQAKLYEEVNRVVGSKRCVSLTDKAGMPYTQAALLELLRYTSVTPLAPHVPAEDATIQGKTIPAGATVLMNLYALHHDEEFWKDPFEFRPERFLDETWQLVSASHPNRRHLMPFGAGPRVCLGEILAKSRLFLIISSLAQNFNIRPGNLTAPHDPRLLNHGIVLSSADFEIIVEERM